MPDLLKTLYEERAKLDADSKGILDTAEKEERSLTDDDKSAWDKMDVRINEITDEIARREAQTARSAELAKSLGRKTTPDGPAHPDDAKDRAKDAVGGKPSANPTQPPKTYNYTLQNGVKREIPLNPARATPEYEQAVMAFIRRGADGLSPQHLAAMQVDSDIGGGYIAAYDTLMAKIIQAMDVKLAIRPLATVLSGAYGETLGCPTLDTDITMFEFGAGELTDAAEDTGLEYGKRELKAHPIKRKVIKISKRLLESPRINVEAHVVERTAVALAKCLENAYMTGTGAEEPLGLFTPSSDGIPASDDFACASATTIVGDDLIDVQGTLTEGYVGQWLFHRDTITHLRKKKTGDGQYLWQPGLQSGQPNMILGEPYVTGYYVPSTMTTGLYIGMYADFSYYWILDVISMQIQRLIEKYATTGQVGLLFDALAADAMPILSEAFVRIKMG